MRRTVLAVVLTLVSALPAAAQTKFTGKVHCSKPDPVQMVEVGDKPGHMLGVQKAECTWSEGQLEGVAMKSGHDVSTMEASGATARVTGYHVGTLENGATFTVRFNGTGKTKSDHSGTDQGKWSFVSGTGTLKGIKGGGTFTGTEMADGSSDVSVEGEYTIAKAAMPAKKK